MAFPVWGTVAPTNGTTATTSAVCNMPTGIAAGNLLIGFIRNAAGGTITWPNEGTDWIQVVEDSSDASNDTTSIAWRKADGNEASTITVALGTSGKFAAIIVKITGAADPTVQPPELSTIATGSSLTPDATTCTPTGGAKDYLWLVMEASEGENSLSGVPTGYSDINSSGANSGAGGAVATNCRVDISSRTNNAASEDSGNWTLSGAADDWSAWTMAIHPAAAATFSPSPFGARYRPQHFRSRRLLCG